MTAFALVDIVGIARLFSGFLFGALLASWASDRSVVRNKPALRKPPGVRRAVPVDDVLAALRSLDRGSGERARGP